MTQPLHISIIVRLLIRPLSLKECSVLDAYFKITLSDRFATKDGWVGGWFLPSYKVLMEAELYTTEYMN